MIRYTLLWLLVSFVCVYSFKDWFKALCLALPLLAFLERPDMPRAILDISGANPFNLMLGFILLGLASQKAKENLRWPVDKTVTRLMIAYAIILAISTFRGMMDPGAMREVALYLGKALPSKKQYFIDGYLNTFKWAIPGLLFCYGAINRQRVEWAAWSIMATGLFLSLQVISKMAPAFIGADDLATRALRVLDRDLGYHRVDLATITGSVSWGFLLMKPLARNQLQSMAMTGGFVICAMALIGTGGRAGMLAWAAAGFVIGFFKWRRMLLLGPVFGIIAILTVPGLQERVLEGFTEDSHESAAAKRGLDTIDSSGRDTFAVTSGRVVVWPRVIDKIMEEPLKGHGRSAMQRTGITAGLLDVLGTMSFGHPHNAYLELFLDVGLIAAIPILAFFGILGWRCLKYFITRTNTLNGAVAGLALGFLVVQSVAAMGSMSFYPKIGAVLLWSVIGLALRHVCSKDPVGDDLEPEPIVKNRGYRRRIETPASVPATPEKAHGQASVEVGSAGTQRQPSGSYSRNSTRPATSQRVRHQ